MAGLWTAASNYRRIGEDIGSGVRHAAGALYNATPGWDTISPHAGPLAAEIGFQAALEGATYVLPEWSGAAIRATYPVWRHLGRYGRPLAQATVNAVGRGARNYVRARIRPFLRPNAWREPHARLARAPFVRYPRMYARPVPEWQSRFVRADRRLPGRRRGRGQFFMSRDAWKAGFLRRV